MENRPKISICVPVYNGGRYLARFLDSALSQTFDDYEIVLADNWSTDGSMDILRAYERAFPGKIVVCRTDEHGHAGKGRNLAFRKAKGEYIYSCDADDILHPDALRYLYCDAVNYKADVVRGNAMLVWEKDGELTGAEPFLNRESKSCTTDELLSSGTFFWRELIRRDLIEKVGPMPEDGIFEDARYLGVLHSYAVKNRFSEKPVYYWINRSNSTTFSINGVKKEIVEDSILADKYIIANCNPKSKIAAEHLAAWRNRGNLFNYWQYFDITVDWIREQGKWAYDNKKIKDDNYVFDTFRWADKLADIEFPNTVYVDGFHGAPAEARLAELKEKVFHDGCEVVVLSEKTCDVGESGYVKRAYDRGDLDLVTGYFALKAIYERGGVYIHDSIRILNYFSSMKYQKAFFALLDKTTYSDRIYGGVAGSEVIASLLETFSDSWDKKGAYMSMSERISVILTGKYGLPQDGAARLWWDPVSVIPPDLSVADTRFGNREKMCTFEHDFSTHAGEADYITLPRESLRDLMASRGVPAGQPSWDAARELDELKRTNTYKLMMKIRQLGDGPFGPFLKKIYHGLLWLRAKFKQL